VQKAAVILWSRRVAGSFRRTFHLLLIESSSLARSSDKKAAGEG
jgi:hypothetical protein